MKKAAFIKGGAVVAGLLVILGIVIQWIGILCFDKGFYAREYAKLGTAASIGMSQEDLDAATQALLDYTRGAREDLSVTAEIRGERREVFNERETLHMADVRNLYLGAMTFGWIALAVGLAYFVWAIFFSRERQAALMGYIHANWVFLLLFGLLALFAALDFNTFWTNFHRVFFTNDLWLLDPRTDILIQMVPGQFFFDLVMRIAFACVGTLALLLLGAWLARRHERRQGKGNAV